MKGIREKIISLFEMDVAGRGYCSKEIHELFGFSRSRIDEILSDLFKKGWLIQKDPSKIRGKNRNILYKKPGLISGLISGLNPVLTKVDISGVYPVFSEKPGLISGLNPVLTKNVDLPYISPYGGLKNYPLPVGEGGEIKKNAVLPHGEENIFAGSFLEKTLSPVKETPAEAKERKRKESIAKMRAIMPPNLKITPLPKTRLRKDPMPWLRTKKQKKKDEALEAIAQKFVHVRYRNMHPNERDYLFLEEATKTKLTRSPGGFDKMPTILQFIASDKKSVTTRKACRRGRQRADSLNAKYDDYFWGVYLTIGEADSNFHYKTYRQRRHFGCEKFEDFYKEYFDSSLREESLITRDDVETGAPEFLPENFDVDRKIPHLYENQCDFYLTVLDECDRQFRATPSAHEYVGRIAFAVNNRILPVAFVEGYGVHHRDRRLKGFKCPIGTDPFRLRHIIPD